MKYMCKSCKTVCTDMTEHITKVHKFSEFIMKLQLKTNPNTYKNCFVKIKIQLKFPPIVAKSYHPDRNQISSSQKLN